MKIECVLEKLKSSVISAERMVGRATALPVLSCIRLSAEGQTVIASATNLSLGIEMHIPARVTEPGVVAIPAHPFAASLQGIASDEKVTLETVGDQLKITFRGGSFSLKTVSHEDFPAIPRVLGQSFSMSLKSFLDGIKSVLFAAAQTDIKPELGSVFVSAQEGQLVFVATDAFRLCERKIQVKGLDSFPDILIPAKNASEMIRALPEVKESVEISVSENQCSVALPGVFYITSRLTAGTYPDYKTIIPKESKTECIVLKSDLQAILKTLASFSDRDFRMDMSIDPEKKEYTIVSKNPDVGEGIYRVPATLKGNPIEVRVNQRHVSEVIASMTGDSIALSFTEPQKPILVTSPGETGMVALLMPLNR